MTDHRARVLAYTIGLLLLTSSAVAQQGAEAFFGLPVTNVRFEVEGRPSNEPALAALVPVTVGKALAPEDVSNSLKTLMGLGRYDDVVPYATSSPGGVDVTFRLLPRHPITKIDVVADTDVLSADLRRQLQETYGGVPNLRVPLVEGTTKRLLNDEGFLTAEVASDVVPTHNPDAATLMLKVRAGPLTRIASVRVDIPFEAPFTPDEIQRRTQALPGRAYRAHAIDLALTEIEDDLRNRGFYEARTAAIPTFSGTDVNLVLTVDPGPRVAVVCTNLPGSEDMLIPIKREHSVDQDLLDEAKARIEAELRKQGYWKAIVRVSRDLVQNGANLLVTCNINRGPKYLVDQVIGPAGLVLPEEVFRSLLEIKPGEVFSQARYETGRQRVAAEYRRRGYYGVKLGTPVTAEIATVTDSSTETIAHVILRPEISVGPLGRIVSVPPFVGVRGLPDAELGRGLRSRLGGPYVEREIELDRQGIESTYQNAGYREARVRVEPRFANDSQDVTLVVTVDEGARVIVGDITVLGNSRLSTATILDRMQLVRGQPLGSGAEERARHALSEMGFRRFDFSREEPIPGQTEAPVHVVVTVVEAPATTGGFGGGLEARSQVNRRADGSVTDRLDISPRGSFDIGRRNLGGRDRSINFFSRVGFHRATDDQDSGDTTPFGFLEYRVNATLQQRHAFRSNTDTIFGFTAERAVRSTFNFVRRALNADAVRRLSGGTSVSGSYRLDFTKLLNDKIGDADRALIDRLFPQVRLSILSAGFAWDRRNNPLSATSGTLLAAEIEFALRAIGSEVGYAKTFVQASAVRGIGAGTRTVVAVRGQIGVARGFPRPAPDANSDPIRDVDGTPQTRTVEDLPASQRFYAGGSTSVRGFGPDRLGILHLNDLGRPTPDSTLNAEGLSLGGNAVIVLNAELRRVVRQVLGRPLTVVGFVDAGNVFARTSEVNLGELRGAVGFGARYNTPFGAIRFDVGFKLDRLTFTQGPEKGHEFHLSIGEAF